MPMHAVLRTTAMAVLLFLSACGGGGGGGGGPAGTPGKVAVTDGVASGGRAAGETVHVFADPAPDGQVFDHWAGDTSGLADPESWHTTFRLGNRDVNLRAVFAPAADWNPTTELVNGESFMYHVPSNPKGLVLFFHGLNGDAALWFTHPEYLAFLRATVARGYGVAALTSSGLGSDWRLEPIALTNPDIRNVVEAWGRLVSSGVIGAITPVFTVGLSDGGRFSVRLCSLVPCIAQALIASQGDPPSLMGTTTVPTRFNMLERDTQGFVDAVAAKRYSDEMVTRGVVSEFELLGPSPVYPERFARIPGLTVTDSRIIHDALADAGYLDANDFLLDDPYLNASGWREVIPARYDEIPMRYYLEEELDNAWSAHGFYGEHFPRTMRFFEQALAAR
ncbi:MAG TPA: hypothetical protein VJM11_02935 [Nevskiaceae bacterium]|nr:hypothetical protein [Nevskiaceae bacterium]